DIEEVLRLVLLNLIIRNLVNQLFEAQLHAIRRRRARLRLILNAERRWRVVSTETAWTLVIESCALRTLAIALWKLATNTELRLVPHLFGVGISTVWKCTHEFCRAANKVLLPELMPFPNIHKLAEMATFFEQRFRLPQCISAIDGKHIHIISPTDYHTEYFNWKGWHSIVLQGVVDGRGLFWHVSAGYPGSMHDARVLHVSELWDRVEQGLLFPNQTKNIAGQDVGFYVLGDAANPLQNWLLKPFPDTGSVTAEQRTHNFKISRTRCVVEKAFGRLKGRWRCLLKRNDCHVHFVKSMVLCCCILHNLCEMHGERYIDEWDPPVAPDQLPVVEPNREVDGAAVRVRNALMLRQVQIMNAVLQPS
uniref:DDE Tnp4 domain-containing protein n=1 Tax=Paramormyrops kingsleyae TaxID=1676925 RepID=A0A3B3R9Y3_9TELE